MEEMEGASSLKRGTHYDMSLCVICQHKRRKDSRGKSDTTTKLSDAVLVSLQNAAQLRNEKRGTEYSAAIAMIDAEFAINEAPSFVWHRDVCRPNFTNKARIDRLEEVSTKMDIDNDEYESPSASSSASLPPRQLRSNSIQYDETHCIICCCGDESGSLHLVTTFNVDHALKEKAKTDFMLLARLEKAHDAMAGDILYHRNCIRLVRDMSESDGDRTGEASHSDILLQLCRELRCKIDRGCAVLLEDCWLRYKTLCEAQSVDVRYESRRMFFKEELRSRLSQCIEIIPRKDSNTFDDDVIIPCKLPVLEKARLVTEEEDDEEPFILPSYNEDEMLSLVHVALQLRGDLMKQTQNTKSKLNDENCMACVPESVYMFLTLLLGGQDLLDGFDHDEPVAISRKRNFLSVGQDLLYAVSNGKHFSQTI
jgi:hypothetical protein